MSILSRLKNKTKKVQINKLSISECNQINNAHVWQWIYIQGGRRVQTIKIWIALMNVYTFTNLKVKFVWNVQNSEVFIAKTMLGLTTMFPNPTFTRWCKPETSMDRHPFMLSNTCSGMTNRFTNICGITLSALIFVNSIAWKHRRNMVFVLEKTTDKQPIYKNNFEFSMWIKLWNNVRELFFQWKKIDEWSKKGMETKKGFLLAVILGFGVDLLNKNDYVRNWKNCCKVSLSSQKLV